MGLFDRGADEPLEADIVCEPQGKLVTPKRYAKISEFLDENEDVHFLFKTGVVNDEGAGDTSLFEINSTPSPGVYTPWTAFTDKRVLIVFPGFFTDDELTIPYPSIISVNSDDSLLVKKIALQTASTKYSVQLNGNDFDKEIKPAMRFLRDTISKQSEGGEATSSPTQRLKELKQLLDEGVITTEEFEETKASLLSKLSE